MAIKQQISFEGLTYNLDNRDRVAASTVHQSGDPKPFQAGVQRNASDAALTVAEATTLLILAADVTSSRIITMPKAIVGRYFRVIWEVEQATSDRVFTCAGTDVVGGNITTKVQGDAVGDGDVVAVAITTVAITCVDDVNIGSYLEFYCGVAGTWLVVGELVVDAVGSVPTLA